MTDVFDAVFGQSQVRNFLRSVIERNAVSHSYLFVGPPGSNKRTAAYAFAQGILCKNNACGTCETCKKIARHKHPDVRYFTPEGASSYLADQMREIIADSSLAPIQADKKVYIIDNADMLGTHAANAFLKTLEEPQENLVLILLARTKESVLPTIVSRCQVVPFRYIPPMQAAEILVQNTDVPLDMAAAAIQACGGSITQAAEFLRDKERVLFRRRIFEIISLLNHSDDLDILHYAEELIVKAKAPIDAYRSEFEKQLAEQADFLDKAQIRRLEQQHKRELSAQTMQLLKQACFIARSFLRDAMMIHAGCNQLVVNVDVLSHLEALADSVSMAQLVRAIEATDEMTEIITYNVSPETCLDVMLFDIREALYGANSSHRAAI